MNRTFVIWQSENTTWSFGLFDADNERLVEAKTGLTSESAARLAYTGANPGSEEVVVYKAERKTLAEHYDDLALELLDPHALRLRRARMRCDSLLPLAEELGVGETVRVVWYPDLADLHSWTHATARVCMDADGDKAVRTDDGQIITLILGDGTMNLYVCDITRSR